MAGLEGLVGCSSHVVVSSVVDGCDFHVLHVRARVCCYFGFAMQLSLTIHRPSCMSDTTYNISRVPTLAATL